MVSAVISAHLRDRRLRLPGSSGDSAVTPRMLPGIRRSRPSAPPGRSLLGIHIVKEVEHPRVGEGQATGPKVSGIVGRFSLHVGKEGLFAAAAPRQVGPTRSIGSFSRQCSSSSASRYFVGSSEVVCAPIRYV